VPRLVRDDDDYLWRALKYIPSEIIMAYIAIEGILVSTYRGKAVPLDALLWGVSILLMVITPLWLWRVMRVNSLAQLFLSTLSFAVWLFAMGGPFVYLKWYEPALGAIVLPIYTLLVPIVNGTRVRGSRALFF
jgi:hypothetical protein